MRKLHTTLYFGLSIFIALLSVLTLVFFFRIIKNKNEHTNAVLTTLENKMIDKENASLLTKKIGEINVTHDEIGNHFVDPTKIDDFVGYLEQLGESNGANLSVKNVQPSKDKINNMISVEISINGPFPNVMKTIGLLENSPYQISVNSAYLNKEIKNTDGNLVTKIVVSKITNWQADISFNILSKK